VIRALIINYTVEDITEGRKKQQKLYKDVTVLVRTYGCEN
jgi:hypothetical protein